MAHHAAMTMPLGARASRPRHGSAGTVPAPSLTLPHWQREPAPPPSGGRLGGGLRRRMRLWGRYWLS